jgi:hypothetical protein
MCGLTAATVALFVDTNKLVEMLSIGTLLAYSMVAMAVILDRYKPHTVDETSYDFSIKVPILKKDQPMDDNDNDEHDAKINDEQQETNCFLNLCKRRAKDPKYHEIPALEDDNSSKETSQTPTEKSYGIACMACACLTVSVFGFCLAIPSNHLVLRLVSCLMGILTIASFVVLLLQPKCAPHTRFSVPFVPTVPLISIVINEYLLTNLSHLTWASFTAWSFIGK